MNFFSGRTKALLVFLLCAMTLHSQFKIDDQGVFKKRGVDLMIYNDSYNEGGFFDEKVNGIQMIHHGQRTVTGGAVRLSPTPEQWDLTPNVTGRVINTRDNSALVTLQYTEYDFTSKIKIEGKENGCLITVILDKPVPKELEGKAAMHIEFLPSAYFKKTYTIDGKPGICPLYPTGPMTLDPLAQKIPQWGGMITAEIFGNEYAKALPIATGKKLVLAPDDPKVLTAVSSLTGQLNFLDGRNLAQNGWLVVQEIIPAGKTGNVVQWLLSPNSISNYVREPVISHSQVGYHTLQEKIAVIELDTNFNKLQDAVLYRLKENGEEEQVLENKVKDWGKFMRYFYQQFDFSSVNEAGLYVIKYGSTRSEAFPISNNVYNEVWHPTLDVWFPVQMDHMFVNEAYRVWHGASHLDDALQAPLDTNIHDGYSQNGQTDTQYKPYERIPGLNIGGWYDAGDFDIRTNSHCETVLYMAGAWEDYKLPRDQTMVDKDRKYVEIHRPDGYADLQQQIEHGTLALIAQHRAVGHAIRGIIVPQLHRYHHLGDAVNKSDNLNYNPALKPYQTDGYTSGTPDDRWAFTNVFPPIDFQSAAALAAASRALRGYNDKLAEECMTTAKKIWDQNINQGDKLLESMKENGFFGMDMALLESWLTGEKVKSTVELLVSTGDTKYSKYLKDNLWPEIKDRITEERFYSSNLMTSVNKALPYMDKSFSNEFRGKVFDFKKQSDSLYLENPYGIPVGRGGFWEGTYSVIDWSITAAKLHKTFPDIIPKEYAIRGLNYILGCHPASSISFVSGVGTNSKTVTYGNNRADFTFIAGGVVPGVYLIRPDFFENKEDWPFIWYENECVIDMCAGYIYLSALVNDIVTK